MKPDEYRDVRIISRDTPYQVEDLQLKGTHSVEGTLQAGRVVWAKQGGGFSASGSLVPVYAEGVGIIFLEPHCFGPAERVN